MKEVSVTTLRQNLPDYLALVEQGETVRVTVRGRVIAEIRPPALQADQSALARSRLRGSVLRYDAPLEPVLAAEEWDMHQ